MEKIIPHLCYDDEAEAAVDHYVAHFPDSRVLNKTYAGKEEPGGAEGSVRTILFELCGQRMWAVNGGPTFRFTPSISLMVRCSSEEEITGLNRALEEGGEALMALDDYGFSRRFSWVNDRFGVSWQLNLPHEPAPGGQKITPFLMFVGEQAGKAEEAVRFYVAQFEKGEILNIDRYGKGEGEPEGFLRQASFILDGSRFFAMDSGLEHAFTFSDGISFYVRCRTQEEIDRLWTDLSEGGRTEECGWLVDRYGVSWQIVPEIADDMVNDPDPEKSQRVVKAILGMKKLDIEGIRSAYED